jgi:hypothetical protein
MGKLQRIPWANAPIAIAANDLVELQLMRQEVKVQRSIPHKGPHKWTIELQL